MIDSIADPDIHTTISMASSQGRYSAMSTVKHTYRLTPFSSKLHVRLYDPGVLILRDKNALAATSKSEKTGNVTVHIRRRSPAAVAVHESVHAACYVLRHAGVDINEGDNETLAYLTDHIYQLVRRTQALY